MSDAIYAQQWTSDNHSEYKRDTLPFSQRFIHRLGVEGRAGYIFQTNPFLEYSNHQYKAMKNTYAGHLEYSFQFRPHTVADQAYIGAYQGIGVGYFNFGNPEELGNPLAVYLFQGGRIAQFSPRISLNYEWNFGASFGWKKYDEETNPYNTVTSSKINAYINLGFFLNWQLSPCWNFTAGVEGTHFSNGNSHYPNSGVNTIGARIGITRNFGDARTLMPAQAARPPQGRTFVPHISYDLVVYGATKIRGWVEEYNSVLVPGSFGVAGINFNPMYNFHRVLRAGISIDAQYDESANLRDHQAGTNEKGDLKFYRPPFKEQFNAGLSARIEFVMPVFSINLGVGYHFLHKGNDTKGCYQVLALKTSLTRNLYLHIGYQLQNFHDPNHLMLGLGWRFNNRRTGMF